MAILDSPALAAQTAGGGTVTTVVDTFEISEGEGVGVTRCVVTPPPGYTTVTGVATNNVTVNVRQLRAGTSLGTFATITLVSGVNLVAEVPLNIPITTAVTLQQDDVIDVQLVQNGTGLAVGAGLLVEVTTG